MTICKKHKITVEAYSKKFITGDESHVQRIIATNYPTSKALENTFLDDSSRLVRVFKS